MEPITLCVSIFGDEGFHTVLKTPFLPICGDTLTFKYKKAFVTLEIVSVGQCFPPDGDFDFFDILVENADDSIEICPN